VQHLAEAPEQRKSLFAWRERQGLAQQAFGGRVVAAPDIRARAQREHFGQQRGLAGQLASRQRERRPQPGRDVDVRLAEYSGSACRSSDTRVSRTATFSCAWRAIARACCT
jgi:hypothetical protein